MSTLFMETTTIDPARTVAELTGLLARGKAQAILTEFDPQGEVAGVSFRIDVGGQLVPFKLPCRWEQIFELLKQRGRRRWMTERQKAALQQKAKRVAWRQLLRWVQAQLALIETQMVKVEEVFLPYVQLTGGQTLYEKVAGNNFLGLEHKP